MVNKKILWGMMVLSLAAGLTGYGTKAFFSDTETSQENVLGAGAIDLRIGNESYYNGVLQQDTSWTISDLDDQLFFNFTDLKPGDISEDTITLSVNNNPSWVCANIKLTSNDENTINDPESDLGDKTDNSWGGELASELNFVFWADDGDNVYESNENIILQGKPSDLPQGDGNLGQTFPIVDPSYNAFGEPIGTPFPGVEERYIGKAWCFGNLTLQPVNKDEGQSPAVDSGIRCNGSAVSNISQTDKITGDILFTAVQARNNEQFACIPQEQLVCIAGEQTWAQSVFTANQAKRKDGSAVLPARSDPTSLIGSPNSVFYSLGFGGSIVVQFTNKVYDVENLQDISIHEITNGRSTYPLEKALVEVSQDGVTWETLGEATSQTGVNGVSLFDLSLSSYSWVKYVKVTDISNPALHSNDADGFDLDAINAYECTEFGDEK